MKKNLVRGFLVALLVSGLGVYLYYFPSGEKVVALVETAEMPHAGDAADDPAIWVHPDDPELSLIIGTDKLGGLGVYDLSGEELQYLPIADQNNVDVRDGFPLEGSEVPLVTVSDRRDNRTLVYRIDVAARQLVFLRDATVGLGVDPAGLCMYRSAKTGKFYFVVVGDDLEDNDDGWVEQWEVWEKKPGVIKSRLVRRFDAGGEAEGCVTDDELGWLYVAEEDVGIWRYGAEPEDGEERVLIDRVGLSGRLRYNVEGLAIYVGPEAGGGYLIASSQGSNDFTVYERGGENAYLGRFKIVGGNGIDGVSHTDGIDVSSVPMGSRFPRGLFVAQDNRNSGGENQNFKLVPWHDIAAKLFADDG